MVEAERRCVCAVLGNPGDDLENGMTSEYLAISTSQSGKDSLFQ